MNRRYELDHQFVEVLPPQLDPGVLYISGSHNIVAHLCCCGCDQEVVTPLGPAGWTLRYDGQATLSPSIGNGALACRSHYVIAGSRVRWLPDMTGDQHVHAQARDQEAAQRLNRSWLDRAKRTLGDLFRRARF